MPGRVAPLEIRIAAQKKTLGRLLDRYRADPASAPRPETLQSVASQLREASDNDSARQVLEFAYTARIEARNFDASNFLGLAEVRLEQGDTAGALALARRMQLISGEPFENLMAAARLLDKFGKRSEAAEFLNARIRAVPWDGEAADLLARWKGAAPAAPPSDERGLLSAIAATPEDKALRISLLRVLSAAGRHQLAISAMAPLVDTAGLRWVIQRMMETGRRDNATEEEEQVEARPYWGEQFLADLALTNAERAEVAARLASAHEELDQLRPAALFLEIARQLQPSAETEKKIAALNARAALQAENERRRPVATENIEQRRTVRPRLAAPLGGVQ
jgi:hypothetical protein